MNHDPWQDALRAAAVFAQAPEVGLLVRARVGPVRQLWLNRLRARRAETPRRLPLHISDDRLLGGIDLEATLRSGRPIPQRGFLAESDGRVVEVPMAERLPPELVGHLNAVLDSGEVATERDGISLRSPARVGLLAFDESASGEDGVAESLAERLGLRADLEGLPMGVAQEGLAPLPDAEPLGGDLVRMCCEAGLALGVSSLRAPLMAARAARASAVVDERDEVAGADFAFALRAVLLPRATQLPADETEAEEEQEPPPEPPDPSDSSTSGEEEQTPSPDDSEIMTEILKANLPSGLLDELSSPRAGRSAGKAGAPSAGGARGRRLASRPGRPGPGRKVDVVGTLRAAAPWQPLRRAEKNGDGIRVRLEDLRVLRRQQRSETVTIFVVDASGSSALQRLAEAKGAVERVLADCYVRRDHVALIAFRGEGARLLLPPTRSLTRAKRELSGLAGGGPTPLADALRLACELALEARRKGRTPVVVLMTDARANVALDGRRDRASAQEDAASQGRRLAGEGVATLVIETSPRPREEAKQLARACSGRLVFLPRLDADAIAQVVGEAGS